MKGKDNLFGLIRIRSLFGINKKSRYIRLFFGRNEQTCFTILPPKQTRDAKS